MSNTGAPFDPDTAGRPAEEREHPPSGMQFGSYRIGDVIGAGSLGTVYRAEHGTPSQQVALKLLAPALRSSTEIRRQFLLRAKMTASIKHRHVIEIVDSGECEGTPYVAMELLEGKDLESYLEARTRLSAEEAASLLIPIVAALAAAHDAGVVHHDLKPSNIFLHRESSGTLLPKLTDFSPSKQSPGPSRDELQEPSRSPPLGSQHYWPPEAALGGQLTARSDQYSFGVVLYKAVTGRVPIDRATLLELLNAIANAEFAPPSQGLSGLSRRMESIIQRCMQRDPAARFADVRELGRALLEIADDRTRMLWRGAFEAPIIALAVSAAPRRVSRDAPTLPAQRRRGVSPRRRRMSWAISSAFVLAMGGVALHAASPLSILPAQDEHAVTVEPAILAASEPAPAAPEPPTVVTEQPPALAPTMATPEQPPAPQPADIAQDAPSTQALEAPATASSDAPPKPPRARAHATRRTRSPERTTATLATRTRRGASASRSAAGERSRAPKIPRELGETSPDLATAPAAHDLGNLGPNEAPIFD